MFSLGGMEDDKEHKLQVFFFFSPMRYVRSYRDMERGENEKEKKIRLSYLSAMSRKMEPSILSHSFRFCRLVGNCRASCTTLPGIKLKKEKSSACPSFFQLKIYLKTNIIRSCYKRLDKQEKEDNDFSLNSYHIVVEMG